MMVQIASAPAAAPTAASGFVHFATQFPYITVSLRSFESIQTLVLIGLEFLAVTIGTLCRLKLGDLL